MCRGGQGPTIGKAPKWSGRQPRPNTGTTMWAGAGAETFPGVLPLGGLHWFDGGGAPLLDTPSTLHPCSIHTPSHHSQSLSSSLAHFAQELSHLIPHPLRSVSTRGTDSSRGPRAEAAPIRALMGAWARGGPRAARAGMMLVYVTSGRGPYANLPTALAGAPVRLRRQSAGLRSWRRKCLVAPLE